MPGKLIVAGAALTAGLALTACGPGGGSAASGRGSAAPAGPSGRPTASAGSGAGPVASAASPGCLVQYRLSASGPAHGAGDNLTAALNGLASASAASDIATMALPSSMPGRPPGPWGTTPSRPARTPRVLACGLVRIEAAADSAGTSTGQGTLTIAQGS
jgi:hypothetical protein